MISRAHDRQLLATQAKTIEALMTAQQANTKAGLALEEARRYTIEEWVLHNGLLRQVPPSLWKEMSTWLRTFCQTHNLKIEKAAVPGKIWAEENTYPLVAFGAWLQHDRGHARQIALVTPLERDATPSEAP